MKLNIMVGTRIGKKNTGKEGMVGALGQHALYTCVNSQSIKKLKMKES